MGKIALKIEAKVENKNIALELTEEEVLTAYSICDKNSLKSVIAMKKSNGGALFFINEANAVNAQQRHGFDYAFDVEVKSLKPEALKIMAAKKAALAKDKNPGG